MIRMHASRAGLTIRCLGGTRVGPRSAMSPAAHCLLQERSGCDKADARGALGARLGVDREVDLPGVLVEPGATRPRRGEPPRGRVLLLRSEGENVAADTDVVMTRIGESFRTEYRDPVHELPYDTGEGGYQGDWFHTYELVEKLGEEIGCDEFVEDVIAAFGMNGWCERDYFSLRPDQALSFSWQRFAELVKYDARYLFLERRSESEFREADEVEPADMLRKLGELVVETGLVRGLAAGTPITALARTASASPTTVPSTSARRHATTPSRTG